jgi:hypothetical protein
MGQWAMPNREERRKLARLANQQQKTQLQATAGTVTPPDPPPDTAPPKISNRLSGFIDNASWGVAIGVLLAVLMNRAPIVSLAICWLLLLFAIHRSRVISHRSSGVRKAIGAVCAAALGGVLYFVLIFATPWKLQQSKPLFIDARATSPGYVSGTLYAGLKWEPEYKEFTINIDNNGGYGIEKVDFEFKVDNGIDVMGAAQADGIANCRFSASREIHDGDSFKLDIDPGRTRFGKQGTTTPLVLHPSREDMVCDRLPAGTGNRVILALRGEIPSTLVVTGSYDLVDGEQIVRKTVDLTKQVKAY